MMHRETFIAKLHLLARIVRMNLQTKAGCICPAARYREISRYEPGDPHRADHLYRSKLLASLANESSAMSSRAFGSRRAWASRANCGSGRSCCGSVIENAQPSSERRSFLVFFFRSSSSHLAGVISPLVVHHRSPVHMPSIRILIDCLPMISASASSIRATGTPNWMVRITVFTATSNAWERTYR